MWAFESVFYQIYPLGFCGAPKENDGQLVSRILKVIDWIPHLQRLGIDALCFNPVFESDRHGYDTRDFLKIDSRLGSNADFRQVCDALHEAGIKVVLDGVFNHVGRGFWAFCDVLKNREASPYKNWFNIRFHDNSPYNDGLYYDGWEGHFELVRLNLFNDEVVSYLHSAVKEWIDDFDIDGIRLDVAYQLPEHFLRGLRSFCDGIKKDFFLVGEILHGDYNKITGDGLLHSATNYQAQKGMWSSVNDLNFFEIAHTLDRHFKESYRGKHFWNFLDNHDVDRVGSVIKKPEHLPLAYTLMYTIPGMPVIYYGSEWGALGRRGHHSDDDLRASYDAPIENELYAFLSKLSAIWKNEPAFAYGDYDKVFLTNRQFVFKREYNGAKVLIALNADSVPFTANINMNANMYDLLTDKAYTINGGVQIPPNSVLILKEGAAPAKTLSSDTVPTAESPVIKAEPPVLEEAKTTYTEQPKEEQVKTDPLMAEILKEAAALPLSLRQYLLDQIQLMKKYHLS